jgi:hypothetical protein
MLNEGKAQYFPARGVYPFADLQDRRGLYPGFRVQTVTMPAVLVHFH